MSMSYGYTEPKNEAVLQLMPLPEGMTVMMECDDEDGIHYVDVRETPYAVCLALVEYEGTDGNVYKHSAIYDLTECEVLHDNSYVVRLQKCPVCGEYMKPVGDILDVDQLHYSCKCGAEKLAFGTEILEPKGRPGRSQYSFGY